MTAFVWMMHRCEVEYPDSGFRAKLGGSYQYSAPPSSPDQRIFKLSFKTMKYFVNANGTIDKTTQPILNFALLEDFYLEHKLHQAFDYLHPVYGTISCKFNKPLKVPKGIEGGNGALESFELELIEMP